MTPQHVKAQTYHKRLGRPLISFRYTVDYLLSEPESAAVAPLLLSRNRFNVAAIHDCDHGGQPGHGSGAAWARGIVAEAGLDRLAHTKLLLLAQPRFLGSIFNPVCFWFFVDAQGALLAFIAEVNNTFGERHSYLCHHPDFRAIKPDDHLTAAKAFHVSPFQPIAGNYDFKVNFGPGWIGIRIDYRHAEGGVIATLAGQRLPATSLGMLAAILRRPVGAVRVLALIHLHAIGLWLRKAPFWTKPEPPKAEVSE